MGARIFEIKGNALDDGPGIRTVVFFKGCPLLCPWCHNPEGQDYGEELSWDATVCIRCDQCVPACPTGALVAAADQRVDWDRCDACFQCLDACPSRALARVGRPFDLSEVLAAIEGDLPFLRASGGGVTLSGGEPTAHLREAGELAAALARRGVPVLLETAGHFDLRAFDAALYPHLDSIYFDLKIHDPVVHRLVCGVDNAIIRENFAALHRRHREGGVPVLARIPLVPGYTATPKNLLGLRDWLAELGVDRVMLLPYNPLWPQKLLRLGRAPAPESLGRSMTREEIEGSRALFSGFTLVHSPGWHPKA
jgi:pyruvate formate lyase activating enzyme